MSLLAARNLTVDIGGTRVLWGIDLTVDAGEIVAITGESGSGKSMTALAVMGLLPRDAVARGQVLLDGTDLLTLPEPALCRIRGRDIGMVFQEPMTALNPLMTIGAQVAEAVRLHDGVGRATAMARAGETLARVGLPPDMVSPDRYTHALSGGQRQRVGIAMAIALRPRLLIADEPTTALDVTTQAQILTLLRGLVADFGMGLILITHDLAVVAGMADRIAVMQAGVVVETGDTRALLSGMRHPYTRALFAAATHRAALPPAAISAPLLQVQGVSRDHPLPRTGLFGTAGRVQAVRDATFTLHRGERLGLVGESGSGKSTLARAILGLEPVQAGQITLDGLPVTAGRMDRGLRRRMQMVFQDPYGSFNPRHRVGRLIAEPLHLLDDPPQGAVRTAMIATALTDVGLHPADAGRYIHEFSGGQRQRIAIARALIVGPDLIVFDEAVSALDVTIRAQVLDLLAALCRRHPLAYLFISHDLGVVRSITDRVLVMQAGRIVEDGPTARVLDRPAHPYTAALIAAAPRLPDFG